MPNKVPTWSPFPKKTKQHKPRRQYGANRQIYSTARWKRLRIAYLANNSLCMCDWCKASDLPLPATDVHHIVDINDGGDPWDENNLQALNHGCHSAETRRRQMEK